MLTMPTGTTVTMRIALTEADRALVEDEVEDRYGSPAMVRHLEVVSRWVLRRCLEDGEEVGEGELSLVNLAPVGVSEEVAVTAVVRGSTPAELVVDVEFRSGDVLAATGTCTQRVAGAAADEG